MGMGPERDGEKVHHRNTLLQESRPTRHDESRANAGAPPGSCCERIRLGSPHACLVEMMVGHGQTPETKELVGQNEAHPVDSMTRRVRACLIDRMPAKARPVQTHLVQGMVCPGSHPPLVSLNGERKICPVFAKLLQINDSDACKPERRDPSPGPPGRHRTPLHTHRGRSWWSVLSGLLLSNCRGSKGLICSRWVAYLFLVGQ